ncbi:hypothetical protein MMC22_009111 [Lobaria immixta]|nr:hypothetical protein [Lobaria immixta]
MEELVKLIGPPPHAFNYIAGTVRYLNLTRLDPHNIYLIPPPGAPNGSVGLEACELLAGPSYGGYGPGNTLDSIATWVVPLLILVGNVNYASFAAQKYWNQITIALHLLGNPVHAIWSLLAKLDVKRRIEIRCRDGLREVENGEDVVWIYSAILYALDDFNFSFHFEHHFRALMAIARSDAVEEKEACKRAAIELSVSRVNNTRRALFAILGYVTAITANIIRADFSDKIPLHISHTIALRELNFWLICAIILSAKVGGYPSEWKSVGVLVDLQAKLDPAPFRLGPLEPWNGGNYTWRPKKNMSKLSSSSDRRFLVLALLAFVSVTAAMAPSLTLSYYTPTKGIGVRSIVELSYWSWWCFNALVTYYIDQYGSPSKKKWLYAIAKDSFSAIFMILFLFSAWAGWWNSCFHWSAALDIRKGRDKAYIDLVGMESDILALMKKAFPIIVALGIGTQLALTTFMIWYSQGSMHPPAMEATEPGNVFRELLVEHPAQINPRRSTTRLIRESSSMEEGVEQQQQREDDIAYARDDENPVYPPAASPNSSSSLLQQGYHETHEMDSFREGDITYARDHENLVDLPAASLNSSSSQLQDYHEMDRFFLRRRESGRDSARGT